MVFALLIGTAAAQEESAPDYKYKPDKEHLIVHDFKGGPEKPLEQIVRTQKEWDELAEGCSDDVKEKVKKASIDFAEDMLVVVAVGSAASFEDFATEGKPRPGIQGVVEEEKKLVVHYVTVKSDCLRDPAPRPIFVMRIPKSDKKVEFNKREFGYY